MEAIVQLDGAKTVQQITSLEGHTPATPSAATPSSDTGSSSRNEATAESLQSDRVKDSQDASGGVSGVSDPALRDQVTSGSGPFTRVTDSDLNSLARQAAGVGDR